MTICVHLNLNYLDFSDTTELDREYQNGFRKLLKVLYANPKFHIAISISGAVLEYYSKKFPEAIELLNELVARSQVEMIGGGFYAPIFSIILPADRSGQIEKNTAMLRALVGKRPRGISLFGDIWNSSLIQSFKACGFEYVLLDSSVMPKKDGTPLIVTEYGKSIKLIPDDENFAPQAEENFQDWKQRISAAGDFVCIKLGMEQIARMLEKKFLLGLLSQQDSLANTTPSQFLKSCNSFKCTYVPSGMKKIVSDKKEYLNINEFILENQGLRSLYNRMLYVNMIISQSHGKDKMRKKASQEKLWESQGGIYFIKNNGPSSSEYRQMAYRHLNEAERCLRENGQFVEAITSYDYDSDGFNEYVCQTENFNAVVSQKGGSVCGLNLLSNGANYAECDFLFDEYLSDAELDKASSKENLCKFRDILFSVKKFNAKRKEILLETETIFSQLKMPIAVQKKIVVSSTGFMVQYILKNNSPFQLKGFYGIAFNISQTEFSKKESQYALELIQDGTRSVVAKDKCNYKNGVSLVQIIDQAGKIAILLEPNEEAGFFIDNKLSDKQKGDNDMQRAMLSWPVDLAAGRSMEKTVNFILMPLRKNRE